jgi:2-dehydropantoate 2-reductase
MPTTLTIAIVGPGAIGSLVAALLVRSGHALFLLDNRKERAATRATRGLDVHDGDSTWHADVASSTHAVDGGVVDLLFVCTKAFDTERALQDARPLLGLNTTVVSIQNGMENGNFIKTVSPNHGLCASTAMGALLETPFSIRWTGHGETKLAALPGTSPQDADTVASILTAAGMTCHTAPDLQSALWEKLIINAAINPTTAIFGIRNGELPEHPEALALALAAALEARCVAEAMEIRLPSKDVATAINTVCRLTADNRSSMLCDIDAGRKTEIDEITGYIVRQAEALGIPTPVNERLLAAVHERETRRKS